MKRSEIFTDPNRPSQSVPGSKHQLKQLLSKIRNIINYGTLMQLVRVHDVTF